MDEEKVSLSKGGSRQRRAKKRRDWLVGRMVLGKGRVLDTGGVIRTHGAIVLGCGHA